MYVCSWSNNRSLAQKKNSKKCSNSELSDEPCQNIFQERHPQRNCLQQMTQMIHNYNTPTQKGNYHITFNIFGTELRNFPDKHVYLNLFMNMKYSFILIFLNYNNFSNLSLCFCKFQETAEP